MKRLGIPAALTAVLALALAGCGVTPPYELGAPTASLPTGTSSVKQSASPAEQSPTSTPSASQLVLSGTGVGHLAFGTSQARVAKVVKAQLGKSTDSAQGPDCEYDSASPWAETVVYDGFWVKYTAADSRKSSPRTLAAWGFQLEQELPATLAIADDVPLNLSFKKLKAEYPAAKYLELGLEDGSKALKLPNKLLFVGVEAPEVVQAGEFAPCE